MSEKVTVELTREEAKALGDPFADPFRLRKQFETGRAKIRSALASEQPAPTTEEDEDKLWPPEKDPPEACPRCGVTRRKGEATFEKVPCPGCVSPATQHPVDGERLIDAAVFAIAEARYERGRTLTDPSFARLRSGNRSGLFEAARKDLEAARTYLQSVPSPEGDDARFLRKLADSSSGGEREPNDGAEEAWPEADGHDIALPEEAIRGLEAARGRKWPPVWVTRRLTASEEIGTPGYFNNYTLSAERPEWPRFESRRYIPAPANQEPADAEGRCQRCEDSGQERVEYGRDGSGRASGLYPCQACGGKKSSAVPAKCRFDNGAQICELPVGHAGPHKDRDEGYFQSANAEGGEQ